MKLLDCNKFIISTDGLVHGLPNKRTLARIIKQFPDAILMFNYPHLIDIDKNKNSIFSKNEIETGFFSVVACDEVIQL